VSNEATPGITLAHLNATVPTIALPTAAVVMIPGDVIDGRYRVIHRIADGGMGTVFLAEHVLIKRRFAIKVLHRELAADTEMVERFMNEAMAAGTLGHPNIVEATDMGFTPDRVPFIVFEYSEGSILTEEIYRVGGLPVRRALRIAKQIASALECAHNANIVHLDLKCDNVFLTDKDGVQDHVKVLDFGISRFLEVEQGKTQRYMIAGTPDYMAPEQVTEPDRVDKRADVYALGVLLYEMLTARRPFGDDDDPRALLHRIVHETPRPIDRSRVPIELERVIVKRMLVKDRARRFQSMREVEEALDAINAAPPTRAPSSPHTTTRPLGGLPRGPVRMPSPLPRATPPFQAVGGMGALDDGRAPTVRDDDPDLEYVVGARPQTDAEADAEVDRAFEVATASPAGSLSGPGVARGTPAPARTTTEPAAAAAAAAGTPPATTAPATTAPATRTRAIGWVAAAVIAAGAGSYLLANRRPGTAPDVRGARAALAGEAERLATTVQAQARAAHTRAVGVAMAPLLRAAIETDPATLRDLAASETLFSVRPGETLEVLIAHGPTLVPAALVPADGAPIVDGGALAAGAHDRTVLTSTEQGLVVSVTVPVTTQRGDVGGALAFSTRIELAGIAEPVKRHALAASLVGLGRPLQLAGSLAAAAEATREQHVTFPISLEDGLARGPVALEATVAASAAAPADVDPAYGCFAVAGLLLLMALWRSSDARARLDA
jgi:serine/threonine-protein kinase